MSDRVGLARLEPWIPALVLGIAALVYLPSLAGDWVWDDVYQYRDNPAITQPWVLATSDVWGPTGHASAQNTPIYRPLAMLSHVPGQILFPGPAPERVLNLALHLWVTAGVALLALALGVGRSAAWFGAGLLACHPAATESVAWISSRGDLMGAGLVVWGSRAFVRSEYGFAGVLFAIAPFCKETFVVSPCVLAIWMFGLRRWAPQALVISLAGVAGYFALRLGLGIPLPSAGPAQSAGEAIAAIGAVAVRAFALLLDPAAPDALPPYRGNAIVGALVLALAVPAYLAARDRRWLLAPLALLPLLAPSAPASLANGLVADRYFYVLLIGCAVASAFAFAALEQRARFAACLFALPLALAPIASLRAQEWIDNGRLFRASLERYPDSAEAQYQVAFDLHTQRGDCQAAIPLYTSAMRESTRAGNNLQACLLKLNRLAEAAALGPQLAERDPLQPTPALNTARAQLMLGNADEALTWAREAVRRNPERSGSHVLLGNVYGMQGRHGDAAKHFRSALALSPGDPQAARGLKIARGWLASTPSSKSKLEPDS